MALPSLCKTSWHGRVARKENFAEKTPFNLGENNQTLHAHESTREVRTALTSHFGFYNEARPHQGIEDRTPGETYFRTDTLKKAA